MDKKEVAKAIYNHLYAIGYLVRQLSENHKLQFSACIIQHKEGDYISFSVSTAYTYDDIINYNNIVVNDETSDVEYAKLFVKENLE